MFLYQFFLPGKFRSTTIRNVPIVRSLSEHAR